MDDYELLDFGGGRRLERFGSCVVDRPCPAADPFRPTSPRRWRRAVARFERTSGDSGRWTLAGELPEPWIIDMGRFRTALKLSPFGHLGIFAEQVANWAWIAEQIARIERPLKLLNLFAYTGASTLAAAAAGAAEVVHVDAARNTIAWARRNAELSGLSDAPIRWVVEDVRKFVRRELKRSDGYDAVILDPPSYGHGRRGEVWRLSKHLDPLLAACVELTAGRRGFVLLTAHTPEFDAERLRRMLGEALGHEADLGRIDASAMALHTADGRALPSGQVVRWSQM
ncbi:MAG: class I SAM-dependent methyltransferase [Pirellulales bacterium]|nr:class I SAM-dependent methyltransferase [Pirellulales bacterium]